MNHKKVISQLKAKYPGKTIIPNDLKQPTEILCEVEPTSEHSEYSLAVAVADRSLPHYHLKATETYHILTGTLTVVIDSKQHHLKKGNRLTINPGEVHYVKGKETWFECYSEPGWTLTDHILVK